MSGLMTACVVVGQRGHGHGQDRAVVRADSVGVTVAVADGAGGGGGGAEAASLATTLIAQELHGSSGRGVARVIASIDARLFRDAGAGETTLVAARVVKGVVLGASVGDSGAWVVTGSELLDVTEEQVRKPLLGSGRATATAFRCALGDGTLLLASDGLLKYVARAAICEVLRGARDVGEAARLLVERARLRSGPLQDDVAVVLARQQ